MEDTRKVIIDIQVPAGETEKRLGEVTKRIEELRAANKSLKSERKDDAAVWEKNTSQIKQNEAEIKKLQVAEKDLSATLVSATKTNTSYSDSFRAQAAQLADLKNQYSSLSKAERESAGGQAMLNHLTELDAQVKKNDASMGNFQRNVGNYPQVFDLSGTSLGRFSEMLSGLGQGATTTGQFVGNAFSAMKAQAISFGKAMITPPIGIVTAILGAIMIVVNKLVDAFKKNDAAATKLQQAFSVLTPIMEGINWVFDKLANVVASLVSGYANLVKSVLSIIPAYKKSADAANELVTAQDRLEERERQYTVNSSARNEEIARLKKEAVNTQKYTSKQIEDMLKRADDLERLNLEEKRANAAEELRLIEAKAKQEKDTSDETANAIAQARAKMSQVTEEYYSGTMRLEQKANAARESQAKEEEERRKAQEESYRAELERRKEAADKAKQIAQELEDSLLASMEEGVTKQIEIERVAKDRRIEELKSRLASESNLTAEAKRNLALLIEQTEKEYAVKAEQLRAEDNKKRLDEAVAAEIERLRLLLEVAEEGSANELNLRMQVIDRLRAQELNNTLLTEEQKLLIIEKYRKQEEDVVNQSIKIKEEAKRQALANEVEMQRQALEAGMAKAAEIAAFELKVEQEKLNQLLALDEQHKAALYATDAEYTAAILESKRKIADASNNVKNIEVQTVASQVSAVEAFGAAINGVLTEVAGNSKEAMVFQKAIALAIASLKLGEAIASASVPAPGAVALGPWAVAASIATNVAAVVVAFAQVTKSIKAANAPQAPKFATGGIVGGASYHGDNVMARVNSREMILNLPQQKRLFDMIASNSNAFNNGFDYDALARAISSIPAPVVSIREFNAYNDRVVQFDNNLTL